MFPLLPFLASFHFQKFSCEMQGRCESSSDGIQGLVFVDLRKGLFFMVPVPLAEHHPGLFTPPVG